MQLGCRLAVFCKPLACLAPGTLHGTLPERPSCSNHGPSTASPLPSSPRTARPQSTSFVQRMPRLSCWGSHQSALAQTSAALQRHRLCTCRR